MSVREKVQVCLKVVIGTAILVGVIYADVTAQMKFTEDTRNGIYEAAYKGGVP